jgi:hypothetical protein
VVAGHDQKTPGERRQDGGVEDRRAEQRQRRDPFWMRRRKPPQIARTAPGKMGALDPEMVEQLGEAGLDRAVLPEVPGGCYGRAP